MFLAFRLIEWIFYNINSEDTGDEVKAVFLKGLYELLSSEGGKSPHAPMLPVSVPCDVLVGGWGRGVSVVPNLPPGKMLST